MSEPTAPDEPTETFVPDETQSEPQPEPEPETEEAGDGD